MHILMSSNLIRPSETFIAARVRAFKRSITSMCAKMFLKIRRFREGFIAKSAFERPFVGMSAFMNGQCACNSECFSTTLVIAHVGFFSRRVLSVIVIFFVNTRRKYTLTSYAFACAAAASQPR